jgi:hypothetical protein
MQGEVKLSDLGIARRLGGGSSSMQQHAPSKSADAVMDRAHVASHIFSSGESHILIIIKNTINV